MMISLPRISTLLVAYCFSLIIVPSSPVFADHLSLALGAGGVQGKITGSEAKRRKTKLLRRKVSLHEEFERQAQDKFLPFGAKFKGGVRVAVGDVNGDSVPDVIVAPGASALGPRVRVFDGVTAEPLSGELGGFFAYDQSFTGGVYVAAGDINNDGRADIITGAGASSSAGPHVKVFSGTDGSLLESFFAFDQSFTGGVRVAAGDLNLDQLDDIIVGAGPGGFPQVKAFSSADLSQIANFFPYNTSFNGGVFVAAGDVNGDDQVDIITGADAGSVGPSVSTFSSIGVTQSSFFAYDQAFLGGVRVATGDVNLDGRLDIIVAPGTGFKKPEVLAFDGISSEELATFFAFDAGFRGGVFVGAR